MKSKEQKSKESRVKGKRASTSTKIKKCKKVQNKTNFKKKNKNTSETPEGRSATFLAQARFCLFLSFFSSSFSLLRWSKSFVGLNC